MTSSSSISGGVERRCASAPRSASSSRAGPGAAGPGSRRRAAPGPPAVATSSRWGPWPVKPRSRSESTRSASSATSSSACRRASAGGRRCRVPVESELARTAGRTTARSPRRRRARSAISARPVPASCASQLASAAARGPTGARPHRPISALRWASAWAYARRVWTRAGHSAATNWSRWPRRSDGAPLISSSRSGRNTHTSGRSGRRAAARPARRRPSSAWARRAGSRPTARARRPRRRWRRSRAPPAPKRTTSRSFEVRQERPVQPKYSASIKFVLPAPFGPVITVRPSPSATSAVA